MSAKHLSGVTKHVPAILWYGAILYMMAAVIFQEVIHGR
jgi:hypothetical protein